MSVEHIEFERGTTRSGHKGFVAWIDGPTRQVHVAQAKCIGHVNGLARLLTLDGEHDLVVPDGRLQWCAAAALDQLAIDLRSESEKAMAPIQAQLANVTRQLLLDLVAVEMAKQKAGAGDVGKHLEQGIKRIEG